MNYTQLTREQRYQISALLKMGRNRTEIAAVIEKHKSTVSRELGRNTGQRGYRPKQAQRLAKSVGEYVPFTLAALVTTLPVIAYHFHSLSLTALIASLLAGLYPTYRAEHAYPEALRFDEPHRQIGEIAAEKRAIGEAYRLLVRGWEEERERLCASCTAKPFRVSWD